MGSAAQQGYVSTASRLPLTCQSSKEKAICTCDQCLTGDRQANSCAASVLTEQRHTPRRRLRRRLTLGLLLLLLIVGASLELRTSWLQSWGLSYLTRDMGFELGDGPSQWSLTAQSGPFDQRLGYEVIPAVIDRARHEGYIVTRQARPSESLRKLADFGLFPIYHEKSQTGLELTDAAARTIYQSQYPEHLLLDFTTAPSLVVSSLLYIEDRELLSPGRNNHNPATDWDRLAKAFGYRVWDSLGGQPPLIGASTIATQLEKFKHSPGGRTSDLADKFQQMATASLRAYLDGADTRIARQRLVVNYLNSLPLAARAGYGEVWGLPDGLSVWYGTDPDVAFKRIAESSYDPLAAAEPYKQVLSLLLAARRPSWYLAQAPSALESLTDSYLRILIRDSIISAALGNAALAVQLNQSIRPASRAPSTHLPGKGVDLARVRLKSLVGADNMYALDRRDLHAQTTLDGELQQAIQTALDALRDPSIVRSLGLEGYRLFSPDDNLATVDFSVILFERGLDANRLRVNVDTLSQPFDFNNGSRTDLGSTAKLRTLILYLEQVAEIYQRYHHLWPGDLDKVAVHGQDRQTVWVIQYLRNNPGADLATLLQAAMGRTYSASPYQAFFTGGGRHFFSNFDSIDNGKFLTVLEAFERSVNLVFIRMMRDIVDHVQYWEADSPARILAEQPDAAIRNTYLKRFADREGRVFVSRYFYKYRDKAADLALAELAELSEKDWRLAVMLRSTYPEADLDVLDGMLREHLSVQLTPTELATLYERYGPDRYSLSDLGYLARVHPLQLWTMAYLRSHPQANLQETLEASSQVRQDAYRWLFVTQRRQRQDIRIQTLLELDAFEEIHARWQRLGYPFDNITPSLASAIGASGDRPGALAELMGILINNGISRPNILIEGLELGVDTPFETHLNWPQTAQGEQVLPPEVATVVRSAMVGVVEYGTARALKPFMSSNSHIGVIGGKTGTGDPVRYLLPNSKDAVSRTAIFLFEIADQYYGAITVHVAQQTGADFSFTSSLPVRILGTLLPLIPTPSSSVAMQ